MKIILFIINCLSIVFINLNYNLDNNYLFVQMIMNNPISIVELCQDTNFVNTKLRKNRMRDIVVQNYKEVINKLNQEGFDCNKDKPLPCINDGKIDYFIHIIELKSKTSGAFFYFKFRNDKYDLNSWKLVSMEASLDGRVDPAY